MKTAWRINLSASEHQPRSNAHRLLLFYAVECGLKFILMKRRSVNCTTDCPEIHECQHNINKLLDELRAGENIKLPSHFDLKPIKHREGRQEQRRLNPGEINQMWRYGGQLKEDQIYQILEKKLIEISQWIEGQL